MVYYPIGTVVILEGGDRPLMIYGRKQIQATTGKEWDYVACLYPEGNLRDEYTVFFQQEEIGYCGVCKRVNGSFESKEPFVFYKSLSRRLAV